MSNVLLDELYDSCIKHLEEHHDIPLKVIGNYC